MRHLFFIITALLTVSCTTNQEIDKNKIVVSILPQKYFIEQIAGNTLHVTALIPPGASPATYEPTPQQLKDVSHANLYFVMGHLLFEDVWKSKFIETNNRMKIIDLSQNISEIITASEHHHGNDHHHEIDPHTWMSPKNTRVIISEIYKSLTEVFPENQELYRKNYNSLINKVEKIDSMMNITSSTMDQKSFLIFHPALSYLANDYGLHQIPIEYEGKEPSPEYLKDLIKIAKDQNINIIFVQKEFNKENARAIANEINAQLVEIDPLGYDWEKSMLDIIEKFTLLNKHE